MDVKKMLPIPNLPDADFKEAKPFVDRGLHARLYRFSPDDFKDITAVWTGEHPLDGTPLEVRDGLPEEDGGPADPPQEGAVFSPGYHPEELKEIADRLLKGAYRSLSARSISRFCVAVLDRAPLVVQLLALGDGQLDLRARALEVDPRRARASGPSRRLADQPLDLALVQQQLARALGVVVLARAGS